MKLADCQITDDVFEWCGESSGVLYFNATAMERDCISGKLKHEKAKVPLECLYRQAVDGNGIEKAKLENAIIRPILIALMEDSSAVIVDGNHRIVKAKKEGLTDINAYVVKYPDWKQYLIEEFCDHGPTGFAGVGDYHE